MQKSIYQNRLGLFISLLLKRCLPVTKRKNIKFELILILEILYTLVGFLNNFIHLLVLPVYNK
ncbi:MAG: hypothetical protein BGO84_03925 [Dysgonomonas sp. 37-18]|nr:MAG: hypothetical protein BGO84_03925 [Dysgonomonas sp. 37-18]